MTRSEGRLGPWVTCALAILAIGLAAPGRAQAQETTVLAPTPFDVDGGSVTTPALEAGKTYRLVGGGAFKEAGPNVTFDYDSAYCFGDNNPTPICRGDESPTNRGLWGGYVGSTAAPFYQLAGSSTPPAYTATHNYEVTFTATQSAPLRFFANATELNRDYTGQLGVALYRQDTPLPCSRSTRACVTPSLEPSSYGERPKLGQTIAYLPPDAGQVAVALGPTLPADASKLTVEVTSTDEEQLAALATVRSNSIAICFFVYVNALYDTPVGTTPYAVFESCRSAVTRVLGRCEVLRRKRGGPGICGGPGRSAQTSAASCSYKVAPLGKARKPKANATCRVLPTGALLVVKRRRGGPSLTKVLGSRPSLVIGTPKSGTPTADSRVNVTWIASG